MLWYYQNLEDNITQRVAQPIDVGKFIIKKRKKRKALEQTL